MYPRLTVAAQRNGVALRATLPYATARAKRLKRADAALSPANRPVGANGLASRSVFAHPAE